ncbi:tRNA (adenosine(37)-N6)-threonylcarbamoyltransferase complex ATPase subunit type 1 TsaE [Psychroflexus aestuariivivens]|uniref:tRNA (adenosine(37)-N6)-threonylcarbamoyltransferase complex ATPase subunit type 1 TsaE n=1 Tax=Psychroflexus aestuariivivens TaxID=1795040 RepID=UPI000FDA49AA|nr:tRNA (adenosine(37)-N6)-threonylcarbamoyltransferase complex ATPase subunit type 1 TsaE [Psychroflexus aestuariivivens]
MKITYKLDEVSEVAQKIIEVSKSKNLLFFGEMGTGKTTLIKSIVKALGSDDIVSSPTFALVNEYNAGENYIYHFDFYRIENEEEAYDIGFEEYLNSNKWMMIEWPEMIPSLWPENYTKIEIEAQNEHNRKLILTNI